MLRIFGSNVHLYICISNTQHILVQNIGRYNSEN